MNWNFLQSVDDELDDEVEVEELDNDEEPFEISQSGDGSDDEIEDWGIIECDNCGTKYDLDKQTDCPHCGVTPL